MKRLFQNLTTSLKTRSHLFEISGGVYRSMYMKPKNLRQLQINVTAYN